MTEDEYVIATNRVKITLGLSILRDVISDENERWGVPKKELSDIMAKLYKYEEKLFSMIETHG